MKNRTRKYTNLMPMLKGDYYVKKGDWQKWENESLKSVHILKPKVVKKKKIPYVCLDTNVIIDLTTLYFENEQKMLDRRTQRDLEVIKKLQQNIEQGKVKPIVTPYVLQEIYLGISKYGQDCLRYLKENGVYVLDLPSKKDVYYFEDVENVALRYCGRCKSPYAPHPKQGRKREDQIFPLNYEDRIVRPNIDSRIMAEAALLGWPLLTQNIDHFLLEDRDKNIARINKELRLGENIMPYKPKVYLNLLDINYEFPELSSKYKKYLKSAKDVEL